MNRLIRLVAAAVLTAGFAAPVFAESPNANVPASGDRGTAATAVSGQGVYSQQGQNAGSAFDPTKASEAGATTRVPAPVPAGEWNWLAGGGG